MRVIFLEVGMSKASPLMTMADSIIDAGGDVDFVDFNETSTIELIRKCRQCDVAMLVHYGKMKPYFMRQLAIVTLIGIPVVRNWAGSDVLNVVTRVDVCDESQVINKLLVSNFTDNHRGLVEELQSAGIRCDQIIKQVGCLDIAEDISFVPNSVLAYLPSQSRNFYGAEYIEELIQKYDSVKFSIVGDDDHYFKKYSNVKSYGWVSSENMKKIWGTVGAVIRITEHDGTPRMMYEALSKGKYFIHNNKHLDSIWVAESQSELEEQLSRYLKASEANYQGVDFIRKYLSREPEKELYEYLSKVRLPFKSWVYSLNYVVKGLF